jgi:hypothetical protein
MGMLKQSEETLAKYDGRFLPLGVTGVHSCVRCLDVCDGIFLAAVYGRPTGCGIRRGFSVTCVCGMSGPFSETRAGAVFEWNELMSYLLQSGIYLREES